MELIYEYYAYVWFIFGLFMFFAIKGAIRAILGEMLYYIELLFIPVIIPLSGLFVGELIDSYEYSNNICPEGYAEKARIVREIDLKNPLIVTSLEKFRVGEKTVVRERNSMAEKLLEESEILLLRNGYKKEKLSLKKHSLLPPVESETIVYIKDK